MRVVQRSRFTVLSAVITALAGTLVLAAGVAARAPSKEPVDESFSFVTEAGTECDFDYRRDITVTGWTQFFVNKAGNTVRVTQHFTQSTTHVNVDTGFVLTDVIRGSSRFAKDTGKWVGVSMALRDSTGRLVLHRAGQTVVDFSTFQVVKVTPNASVAAEDICSALGGNPA